MGSGNYERSFNQADKKYHHIFDPQTGYPTKGLSAVTVIHPDPMLADAWATALFVMGAEAALAAVENNLQMEAMLVTQNNELIYSSGMKEYLAGFLRRSRL